MLSSYKDLQKLKYPIRLRSADNPNNDFVYLKFEDLKDYMEENIFSNIFYIQDNETEYDLTKKLSVKQYILFEFIKTRFDEDDFERANNIADGIENFKTFEEFICFQKFVISTTDYFERYIILKEMIDDDLLENMDKEGMRPLSISGFYFNRYDNVTFLNER